MTFEEDLTLALDSLRSGGVIAYPTDTVWGLGCDATDRVAVDRLLRLKERNSHEKALIVLISDVNQLSDYFEEVPEIAADLLRRDRPTTVIIGSAKGVAPGVAATDGTLAVRLATEKYSQELCKRLGRPIVSTSANPPGKPAPGCFSEISKEILYSPRLDYVATYGRSNSVSAGIPSSIIKIMPSGDIQTIRK